MITNEKLAEIRTINERVGGHYFNHEEIRDLIELIDFQAGIISDMKSESTAFDIGLQEGEKKVLDALQGYEDVLLNSEKVAVVRRFLTVYNRTK